MKGWKFILIILSFFVIIKISFAENDLLEVTAANKEKCVEYYKKDGKEYCSTKPLLPQQANTNNKELETLKLYFDNRVWNAAWANQDDNAITVEYIVDDESINDWHELITTQFFQNLRADVTPKQFMQRFIYFMLERGFSPVTNTLSENKDDIIFEYRISEPANQRQNEIQRIFKTKNGLHIIHYVIKEENMGNENRQKWVDLLKRAHEET